MRPRSALARRLAAARAWAEGISWLFVAAAYAFGAYAVVFQTRIGRVVAAVDEQAGRGVHAGDVLAVPLALTAALGFVLGVAALERATRPGGRASWRTVAAIPVPAVDESVSVYERRVLRPVPAGGAQF